MICCWFDGLPVCQGKESLYIIDDDSFCNYDRDRNGTAAGGDWVFRICRCINDGDCFCFSCDKPISTCMTVMKAVVVVGFYQLLSFLDS